MIDSFLEESLYFLKSKYSVTLVLPISDRMSTFVGAHCLFS